MELLAEHLASWASSAAFPELAHTTSLRLRAFAKRTRVERFSSAARGLIAAIAANTCHVGTIRDAAGFAPKDAASVLAFATQLNAAKQVRGLLLWDSALSTATNCIGEHVQVLYWRGRPRQL